MVTNTKILIVDDEQGIRDLLSYELKNQGYDVVTAASGEEAVGVVKNGGDIGVIITDIKMPTMDGVAVLKEVKALNSEIEVIIMTGFSTLDTAIQSLRAGAFDFINKPFNIDEMQHAVKKATDNHHLKKMITLLNNNLTETYIELERIKDSLEEKVQARTKELELSEAKYRSIIENSFDPIIIVNDKAEIVSWNKGAELTFGYQESEAVGKRIDLVAADEAENIRERVQKETLEKGFVRNLIAQWKTKDQAVVYVNITASNLGNGVFGMIVRDITQEKKVDQMKSDFVSNVSHELRTPLTSIKGAIELIFRNTENALTETQKDLLAIIKNNTARLIRLISDLLDLSKIEAGKIEMNMRILNVSTLFSEIIEQMRPLAEKKEITLATQKPDDLLEMYCDRDKIMQVIVNLLGNAMKFTPEKGTVTLAGKETTEGVMISVIDTGIGVPRSQFERIFERFQQVDSSSTRVHGGTGLGLAIAKSIVQAHKGRIWVESETGKGSTFSFIIPLVKDIKTILIDDAVKESPLYQHLQEQEKGPTSFRIQKIMVVDDDEDIARVIKGHLEKERYEVTVAHSGLEAVKKAVELQPQLITLDVLMPQTDGYTVAELLRQNPKTKNIPIVMISVMEDKEKGFRLGAFDYITKPFEPERLFESVKRVERLVSKEMLKKKILIVDDDVDIVGILTAFMHNRGYSVSAVYDGLQAVALAKKEKPDIILLDLMLPEMDGFDVLKALKNDPETENIPIIVETAKSTEEKAKAIQLGAKEYLIKPFTMRMLQEELEKIMEKEGPH